MSIVLNPNLVTSLLDARAAGLKLDPACFDQNQDMVTAYKQQDDMMTAHLKLTQNFHCGWKVALSGQAAKAKYQLTEPVYGQLTTDMQLMNGSTIQIESGEVPKLEIELAFILNQDIYHDATDAQLLDAIGSIVPALEIANVRWQNWNFSINQFVVDNAAACAYILGRDVDMRLSDLDHQQVLQVTSQDLLLTSSPQDNPITNYLWIIRKLIHHGKQPCANDIILTGSLIRPINMQHMQYQFHVLGQELSVNAML